MNKKYLSAILFGTLLAASTGTFTSCKDYDDDIKALQEQIDKNGTTVGTLQEQLTAQLTALQAALQTAQSTADAAKADAAKAQAAADAAKAAGDAAAAEAAQAKVLAEAAKKAAADAEAKALAKITEEVATMKAYVDASIATINETLGTKADKKALEDAIAQFNVGIEDAVKMLSVKIDGVQAELSTLTGTVDGLKVKIATNADNIQTAQDAILNLIAVDEDLQRQLDALKDYDKELKDLIDANKIEADEDLAQAIKKAEDELKAAREANQELWNAQTEENSTLRGLIGDNKNAILANATLIEKLTARVGANEEELLAHHKLIEGLQNGLNAANDDIDELNRNLVITNQSIEALESRINDKLDEIKADMGKLGERITTLDTTLRTLISTEISNLHVLIVARLSSIAFAPDYIVDGVEAVKFSSLQYSAMNPDENALVPTKYNFSVGAPVIASYHFNPKSFNLANATYSYLDRTVTIIETGTRAAGSNLVDIIGQPIKNTATGTVDFTLRRKHANVRPAEDKTNMIALQATMTGDPAQKDADPVITSPYVAVYDDLITPEDIFIADGATLATGNTAHFAATFSACKTTLVRYEMAYDKVFDLKSLVATCLVKDGSHEAFPVEDYELSYRFAVASSEYNVQSGSTITNQQKDLVCTDAEKGTFEAIADNGHNPEFVGRTPIFKVELVDKAGNVVRRGFVKVEIVAEKTPDMAVTIEGTETYGCANTQSKLYKFEEDYLRDNIYRLMNKGDGSEQGMSHEEFWNTYEYLETSVLKNGVALPGIDAPSLIDGVATDGKATKIVIWRFAHGQVGNVGITGANLYATLTLRNKVSSNKYPKYIHFHFAVKVNLPVIALDTEKTKVNDAFWDKDADGKYIAFRVNAKRPGAITSPASECTISQDITKAYVDGTYTVNIPTGVCTESTYEIESTYSNGIKTTTVLAGVQLNGTTISLNKSNTAVKAALNSEKGLQAVIIHKYMIESGDTYIVNRFKVTFIRPVTFTMPDGITVKDGATGGDEVSFQHDGLLTDWRGYAITHPVWESVVKTHGRWKTICVPEYTYVDGHYNKTKDAEFNLETETVTFTTGTDLKMYTGRESYAVQEYRLITAADGTQYWGWMTMDYNKVFNVTDVKISKDAVRVELALQAERYAASQAVQTRCVSNDDVTYNEHVITASSEVSFTNITGVNYVPAVYEYVPATEVEISHEHSPKPHYAGTVNGQTSGCWEWHQWEHDHEVLVPGQFWDYYGEIKNVVLDINNVSTSLEYNNHKLPDDAVLTQGATNTVKYENAESNIGYSYTITIPASIEYGWGILKTDLILTAEPAGNNK